MVLGPGNSCGPLPDVPSVLWQCPCGSAFPICFGWAGFMKQCNKRSLQALESLQGRQTFCTFDSKLPPFLSKTQGPRQSHWGERFSSPDIAPSCGFSVWVRPLGKAAVMWPHFRYLVSKHKFKSPILLQLHIFWPFIFYPCLQNLSLCGQAPSLSHTHSHSFSISLKIFHSGKLAHRN